PRTPPYPGVRTSCGGASPTKPQVTTVTVGNVTTWSLAHSLIEPHRVGGVCGCCGFVCCGFVVLLCLVGCVVGHGGVAPWLWWWGGLCWRPRVSLASGDRSRGAVRGRWCSRRAGRVVACCSSVACRDCNVAVPSVSSLA